MSEESRWPLAAILTAVVAAWFMPDVQPGVNFLIVALSIALTLLLSIDRVKRWDIYFALALALVAGVAVRAATWVVALDLLAAAGLATVAVAETKTFVGIVAAPLRVLGSIGVGLRSLVAPLGSRLGSVERSSLGPVAAGTIVGIVLVAVFGLLFTTADAAFAAITSDLFSPPEWRMDLLAARIITALITLVVCAALVATRASSGDDPFGLPPSDRAPRRVAEWGIPLVMLNLLFGAFVVVQIAVLFGGRAYVVEIEGLTYAEYARQGFFQLLAVAGLTLGVIAGSVYFARARDGAERLWLRLLLGPLCAFTLVILASAAKRLSLYELVYGFTRLRLSVHATIWWLTLIFAFVIVAGLLWRATWLPRATIVSACAGLIVLTSMNPDAWIARRNIEHFEGTGRLDSGYLAVLSPDAVPAIAEIESAPVRECTLRAIATRHLSEDDPWYAWNLGRERARTVLRSRDGPELLIGCPTD